MGIFLPGNDFTISIKAFSGDHSDGETPLPIPNRAVKPTRADGTAPERVWESRSSPGIKFRGSSPKRGLPFYLVVRKAVECGDPTAQVMPNPSSTSTVGEHSDSSPRGVNLSEV